MSLQVLEWQHNGLEVCLDKHIIECNHYDSFEDSLTDYIHLVTVTSNSGLVSWPLYIENYCIFDHNFGENGCYKNRSVNYNKNLFLANNGSPCCGWGVENHISPTNVNVTVGWG